MQKNYNSPVLTSDGYKTASSINRKDLVYSSNGPSGTPTYISTFPTVPKMFYLFETSVDEIPFALRSDFRIDVVDSDMSRSFKYVEHIKTDDWIFHPWIRREILSISSLIDLAKTSSNFYDTKYIYLFNNRILKISEDLNIPQHAVKEILIREAAEYEEYIPAVYQYIRDNFGIDNFYTNETESFKEFKNYIKENFTFKMNRFINIDINYISFVIAFLTKGVLTKTSDGTHCTFEILFRFNKSADQQLIQNTLTFINSLSVKHNITTSENTVYLNIFNKPLYEFLNTVLSINIESISRSSNECIKYFVDNLFKYSDSVFADINVLYQIKQIFLYFKKVTGIKQSANGYFCTLLSDDLEQLDSELIIEDYGYFSRILNKNLIQDSIKYTYIESRDDTLVTMHYVHKIR